MLLLHGGNQSAHSWDLVSLHLADRYHVFALDQRGHGDSDWADEYNWPTDILDVIHVLRDAEHTAPLE